MLKLFQKPTTKACEIDQDPILMSSFNNNKNYTFAEILTGILTFMLISTGAIGLFLVLFGDKL